MNALNYTQLEDKILSLAARIEAPSNLLPTYRISIDGALPHIVIDDSAKYHFIVVERGEKLQHRVTINVDELLYWIFETITFSMACNYELKHRVSNQDSRVLLFSHQEKLLGELRPAWQQNKKDEHKTIIEKFPFDDNVS